MPTTGKILERKEANGIASKQSRPVPSVPEGTAAAKRTTDVDSVVESCDDSDDELGAMIYKLILAAKAKSESESSRMAAPPTNTSRKSERLASLKKTSMVTGGMSIPNECSGTSSNADLDQRRNPCQKNDVTNKRKRHVDKDEGPVPKKQVHQKCSVGECKNMARKGRVCIRHGAKVKTCRHEGCNSNVRQGGVCMKHGAKVKMCSHEGCTKHIQSRGVCIRHGANYPVCSHRGCTKHVQNGGVCSKHGAIHLACSHEGCNSQARRGRFCRRHWKEGN